MCWARCAPGATRTMSRWGPCSSGSFSRLLLLHANRPISRQQLIEAIWGWDAPTYAVNLLQKHVSGLRRALEPERAAGGPALLTWTQAGYLLTVVPGWT